MTDHVTSSRGDEVAFDLRGPGAGDPGTPSVVFVAGAGPHRATDPLTTEVAERVAAAGLTTLVFDRLGRGESRAEGRLDLERELAALEAAVGVVGGRAVLCGHSSGCTIALRATLDAAKGAGGGGVGLAGIVGLALWEAPVGPGVGAAEARAWADEVARRIGAGDLEGAQEHYMKDMPPEWLAGAKASPAWPAIVAGVVTLEADAESVAWAQAALAAGALGRVAVPTLALYGRQAPPGMADGAAAIAAAVPGGEAKELPGANHAWEPGPMADELVAFARRCFA